MIELWIDGERCDVDRMPTIPIGFDIANLTKAEGAREGRSIELTLPATPANNALFSPSHDLYTTERFNMKHHTAIIKRDDVEIFGGTTYLLDTIIEDGFSCSYKIRIDEGGVEWIEPLVHGEISDLEISFAERLNLATISDSWEWDCPVRFLPVYRGNYSSHYSAEAILPVERPLLSDDYHPFISIRDMVQEMFAKTGYKLHSDFFDSELGSSLYMSGDYSRTNNAAAKAKCDFFARRADVGIATADAFGRVYASKAFATHTVGAIVDTADSVATDSEGKRMSDTFCLNNSFQMNEAGNICFTPKMSVRAGFLLHLAYSTEYKILSRERLCGFDMVEGLRGERVEVHLANNSHDYRKNPSSNTNYRALVFDHQENRQYQLTAELFNGTNILLHTWNTRSSLVKMPSSTPVGFELYYCDDGSETWLPYTGDWALYAGYIEESGFIDVEMDFRMSPQDVAAGESLVLDKFWFGGAEPGMQIKVGTATSLRPYFTSVPGYNEMLEFRDVAPNNLRQIDLLAALGEMFNLAFYSDRISKEVYIEPIESLYNEAQEIDWSQRIDRLGVISISDLGVDVPQNTILAYLDTDIASHKFNVENDTTLGKWSFQNPLYGTKDSTRRLGNKLFATTLNISNILGSAPSASIMQVGDMGAEENDFEVPFTPRIVCYKGMKSLPKGESWGIASRIDKYPYAAFVDEEDVNLCFEERNGIEGLCRYHLPTLLRQRDCRKITLDLYLTTAEIATLFTREGSKPSLLSKFRFNIQGESLLFRLAKIDSWDTESNIVRCTFEQDS